MKFNLTLFILLILASAFVYSAWSEDLRVYAADAKNRPIEGVTITVAYQKAQFPIYTGMSYDGLVSQKTNAQGYADFEIHNTVTDVTYELRYYYIEMSYSGLTKIDKITCPLMGTKCHPNEKTHLFTLDTHRVNLNIKDQSGRPVEGALVTYNENTFTTSSTGLISLNIPQNTEFIVVVDYGGSKRTVRDTVAREDKNIDVTFDRYNVRYRIINDEGVPLNSEVILNDIIKQTDEDGYVLFEGITGNQLNVFVRFDEGSREFTSAINQDINTNLIMDMTPPTITNAFHQIDEDKNLIFVNAKVVDPNTYASGLRSVSPVKMRYRIGDGGWKTIEMYTTGKDAFQGTIPYENQLIMYEIEAIDAQENIQKFNGKIEGGNNTNSDNNQTTTDPIVIEPSGEGFINTTTLIIAGVIVLIIAFIGYKFYTGEI
jgi:hypothetical protein